MGKLLNYLKSGTGSGFLLIGCVCAALLLANSPLHDAIARFTAYNLGFDYGAIQLKYSVKQWIDDGLMSIFFLMVGLEIKKELVSGELSSPKKALLPIVAAIGGAFFPAMIYLLFNNNTATAHGWGIPMATDIAFALAVVSMLGNKVPLSLKIFLAALAIVDDLLAILVIALFYSSDIHFTYLFIGLAIFALQLGLNKLGVKNLWAYLIPGIFLWYFIHHSGIHATIAGVLTAMSIPSKGKKEGSESPLVRLEHSLSTAVNLLIIPIFAFVNTSIVLHASMLTGLASSLGLGISTGLLVGKSLGIFVTCWLCVKLKLANLPSGAQWPHIFGVGLLGGIGFTMSIFVAMLSFTENHYVEEAKLAILLASTVAGLLGYFFLRFLGQKNSEAAP
ncbi:Na+/H+ antiporter NhaA [Sphingobacterium sp. Mn56C]|uniref:Na+/H+ antiporter NhaA n=1 Tax=Sphingobacterium sp. Mn56C TaxID=3395261 RepID=UPI003BCF1591